MAISSYNTILKWGSSANSVAKVVDIKSFPDLIGDPNNLETTTLSDNAQTFIPGIRQSDTLQFICNFDKTVYASCASTENTALHFELDLQDGSKFTWEGQYTLGVPGKGVDEVMEFTINILASTPVTFTAGE